MKTIANRLKCQSLSGDGRKPRPAATRLAIVPSPSVPAPGALGWSATFIAHLLDDGRQCELLNHDPAKGPQDSLSGFGGQSHPEMRWNQGTDTTDRARGGTAGVRDWGMMVLLVDLFADGPGTIRPTEAVPKLRL